MAVKPVSFHEYPRKAYTLRGFEDSQQNPMEHCHPSGKQRRLGRKPRKMGQNLRTIVLDQEKWNPNDLFFDETTTTDSIPAEFSAQFGVPAFCKDINTASQEEGRQDGENPRSHVKAEQ